MKKILFLLALVLGFFVSQAQVGRSQGYYNVLNYGMKNDSTGDQTALLRSIVSILPDGATLYFPGGKYLFSDSILIVKNITIIGDGYKSFPIFSLNLTPSFGATTLFMTSATHSMFHFGNSSTNKYPVWNVSNLSIVNNASSTPTAGAAIVSVLAKNTNLRQVTVEKFFIDLDLQSNDCTLTDVFVIGPVQYGIKASAALNPDAGGFILHNVSIVAGFITPTTAIGFYWNSGGLLVMDHCNFNAQTSLTPQYNFLYCIYADFLNNPTSDCIIDGCQFENFQITAIKINNLSKGRFSNVQITNCEIGPFNNTGNADAGIEVDSCWNVHVDNILGYNSGGTIAHPLVKLIKDTAVYLGANMPTSTATGTSNIGYAMADSVINCFFTIRQVLTLPLPSGAVGNPVVTHIAGPGGTGDSLFAEVAYSNFMPTFSGYNQLTSFAQGATATNNVITLGAADSVNPGLVPSTGTWFIKSTPIFLKAIKSDGILFGSGGTSGANIAIGAANLIPATATGTNNHGFGTGALHALTTGSGNMANGPSALAACTTCSFNVAEGSSALTASNTNENTAVGYQTLISNNTGGDVTAVGYEALHVSTGAQNTALGSKALVAEAGGTNNTAAGYGGGSSATAASFCTYLGSGAAPLNVTGNHVLAIGYDAAWFETRSYKFAIGDSMVRYLQFGDFLTGQLCFNCNTTGSSLASLTTGALVEFRGTTGGWLPNQLNTTQQTALTSLTANTFYNTDSNRLVYWNGSKYIGYATTDQLGGGGSGVTTVGAFSGSSQANGATISTSTITFGPADGTNPGMIKASGSQTLGATITFTNAPILTTTSIVNQVWQATGTAGQGGWGNVVTSGTYTPTFTNTTNVSSSGLTTASYQVIGNVVTVRVSGVVTATVLSTITGLTISLPFTTTNTSQGQAGGGSIIHNASSIINPINGLITSGTTIEIFFNSLSTSSDPFSVVFQYTLS